MESRERISLLAGMAVLGMLAIAGFVWEIPAERGHTQIIIIEDMKFTPDLVRVGTGDRIVFQNKGILPHTATAKSVPAFDSGPIKPGDSWTFHVMREETIDFICLYHPMMVGKIVVESP
jgi:plastocyanin